MSPDAQIERVLRRTAGDPDVIAVLLFGSAARGDSRADSDVDICLVLTAARRSAAEMAEKRLAYLGTVDADVQVFQALPLYVRVRVLREGRVLQCRDEDALYSEAFATIRAFERFKRTYQAYLDEVGRDRP